MRTLTAVCASALCLALSPAPLLAQGTSSGKPVRLVVPLSPGGPTDFLARTVAQSLSVALGQPVVVDNRPGADGAIAAREVIGSAPDGLTLLFATGGMVAVPLQSKPVTFDWQSELAPVGRIGRVSFCLVVHRDVPAKTVAELVAYARAQPDKLNFSTSTASELMAAAQFMKAAGIQMNRVPYKGGAQAMPDLLAGRIQVMFGPVTLVQPHLKAGAVRVLATLLPARSTALPDVPTMSEAGYADVSVPTWQAIFAPAKTPAPVLARLSTELGIVLARPEIRAEMERRAIFMDQGTPQVLAAAVAHDQTAWVRLISEFKLGAE